MANPARYGVGPFCAIGGVFSAWLGLDDLFLLHELVLPTLGMPQVVVIALYVGLAAAYVLSSWRIVLSGEFWVLLMGGVALGVSIVVDTYFHSLLPQLVYIEDSAKFFGMFCWFSFHAAILIAILSSKIGNQK